MFVRACINISEPSDDNFQCRGIVFATTVRPLDAFIIIDNEVATELYRSMYKRMSNNDRRHSMDEVYLFLPVLQPNELNFMLSSPSFTANTSLRDVAKLSYEHELSQSHGH